MPLPVTDDEGQGQGEERTYVPVVFPGGFVRAVE